MFRHFSRVGPYNGHDPKLWLTEVTRQLSSPAETSVKTPISITILRQMSEMLTLVLGLSSLSLELQRQQSKFMKMAAQI